MSTDPSTELDFDAPAEDPAANCELCQGPLPGEYFTCGEVIACGGCAGQVQGQLAQGAGLRGYMIAILMGSAAGLAGAAIWYAILVGYMVGWAVRAGSGGRGGWPFQIMAVLMTYFWISANYVPDLYMSIGDPTNMDSESAGALQDSPAAVKLLFAIFVSLSIPFFDPAGNLIGILIIGFGLHQAWSMNRRHNIVVAGPYQLRQDGTAEDPEAPAAPGALAPPSDEPA
ncbi:MAG: hypothetical protein P1V35_10490 [Planctomycetota bacterium]|nr:hypothetical protein [Planctomycetota bacterium]